jgi:hypothetical protein
MPKGLRRIAMIALVLSMLVGFGAVQELIALIDPPQFDFTMVQPPPFMEAEQALYREAITAFYTAQIGAFQAMKGSRTLILLGLAFTTALVTAAAMKILMPLGSRVDGANRLGIAALISAVFRTLDGAQQAAVARRAGGAFDRVLAKSHEIPGGWPEGLATMGNTAAMITLSFLVGGGLLTMSLYFRSERVKTTLASLD